MAKIARAVIERDVLMKNISAKEAKDNFGRLIDTALACPVIIEKHGRPVVVVLSIAEYERLNGIKPERATA
jgi:prevent-host-death family protein